MVRGISEGASKKNLVVFLFGDVLGHSFFFLKHAMFLLQFLQALATTLSSDLLLAYSPSWQVADYYIRCVKETRLPIAFDNHLHVAKMIF